MSSAKFYVHGGGRWRELDTSEGYVEGWGKAHFVYVERGRLRAVRRAPVLRGLRALVAGRARSIHDGASLSQIRHTKNVKDKRASCPSCERRACCLHAHFGCGMNAQFNMHLPSLRTVNASVQADLEPGRDLTPALPPSGNTARASERKVIYSHKNNKMNKLIGKKNQTEILEANQNNVGLNSSDEDLRPSVMEWKRKRKMRKIREAELCKELIIAEEDVILLRNYIEKDEKNVFKVDLEKFDADDRYKSKVFYKLNPLVNVERCKAISDMTWDQQSQSTVTLKDFITNLGLRRVEDPSPSRTSYRMRKRRDTLKLRRIESEQDKENQVFQRQTKVKKHSNKVLSESVKGKSNGDKVKGKVKPSDAPSRGAWGPRRPEGSVEVEVSDDNFERTEHKGLHKRAGGGREYGPAEDAAIVRWLRDAGRGHLVNGNRVWRQLQPEHRRLTGHLRSWHSLRNRYLRYLLPSLGALLPAPAAAALRAAAARGEMKARRRRSPPPPTPAPVRGAWARRPRPRPARRDDVEPDDRLYDVSEPARSLRSRGATPALARAETPTYSELTRRFAERHRSARDSDATEVAELEKVERRASGRLRAGKDADSSIRLDEVSSGRTDASDRRAENPADDADTSGNRTARSRSSRSIGGSGRQAGRRSGTVADSSRRTDSADRREHRTRRLYNPNI